MEINKLEWDSNFFGFEVGKNIVLNPNHIDLNITQPYILTYLFSSEKLVELKERLVDIKCEYIKEIKNKTKKSMCNIEDFSATKYTFDDIKELVLLSGKYSRFKIDKNFEALSKQKWKISKPTAACLTR
jgi:hypothetical protein